MKIFQRRNGESMVLTGDEYKKVGETYAKENGLTAGVSGDKVVVSRADYSALEDLAAGKSGPAIKAATASLEAENAKLRGRISELEAQPKSKGAWVTTSAPVDASQIGQLRTRLASETDPTKRANIAREIRRLTESAKQ